MNCKSTWGTFDKHQKESVKTTIQSLANLSNRKKLEIIKSRAKSRVYQHQRKVMAEDAIKKCKFFGLLLS